MTAAQNSGSESAREITGLSKTAKLQRLQNVCTFYNNTMMYAVR